MIATIMNVYEKKFLISIMFRISIQQMRTLKLYGNYRYSKKQPKISTRVALYCVSSEAFFTYTRYRSPVFSLLMKYNKYKYQLRWLYFNYNGNSSSFLWGKWFLSLEIESLEFSESLKLYWAENYRSLHLNRRL